VLVGTPTASHIPQLLPSPTKQLSQGQIQCGASQADHSQYDNASFTLIDTNDKINVQKLSSPSQLLSPILPSSSPPTPLFLSSSPLKLSPEQGCRDTTPSLDSDPVEFAKSLRVEHLQSPKNIWFPPLTEAQKLSLTACDLFPRGSGGSR
jgi:hypothetical protein